MFKITLYKDYIPSSIVKSFKTYKKALNYAKKYFKDYLFNIYIEK
jgi:hypothetical protein